MIVADTNVLSEPLRRDPDPRVLAWLDAHAQDLAIAAISIGELSYGAARLPAGRRQDMLVEAIDKLVTGAADRLLPYDATAARTYAALRARREASGHAISVEDGMIAGICIAGHHALATRNTRNFADTGIVLHDPWTAD